MHLCCWSALILIVRKRGWASVKDCLADPQARAERKIHFDKKSQRFDASARDAISKLGLSPTRGIYLRPPPHPETLISNLLEVRHVSPVIYAAPSPFRSGREAGAALKERDIWSGDWLLRGGTVFSFRPFKDSDLAVLSDGPGETFDTDEWADSDDSDVRHRVVELLNNTLREMVSRDLRWNRERRYLFFRATRDLRPRRIATGPRGKGLAVFKAYPNKKDPTKIAYYRHSALRRQFLRLGRPMVPGTPIHLPLYVRRVPRIEVHRRPSIGDQTLREKCCRAAPSPDVGELPSSRGISS